MHKNHGRTRPTRGVLYVNVNVNDGVLYACLGLQNEAMHVFRGPASNLVVPVPQVVLRARPFKICVRYHQRCMTCALSPVTTALRAQ